MSAFPCTSCGACCRRAGLIESWVASGYAEPGGPCKFLTNDNLCAIYETRPDCCRMDATYEQMPEGAKLGWQNYVSWNAAVCNAAQIEDGMPESYRVKVTE